MPDGYAACEVRAKFSAKQPLSPEASTFVSATPRDSRQWKVFHAADDFVIEVYAETPSFPKDETYDLTSQMRRAVVVGAGEYRRRLGAGQRARVPSVPEHRIRVACRGGLLHSLGEAAWLHHGRPGNASGCAPQRAQPDAEWPDEVLPAPRIPSSRPKTQRPRARCVATSSSPPVSPPRTKPTRESASSRSWRCMLSGGAALPSLPPRSTSTACSSRSSRAGWALCAGASRRPGVLPLPFSLPLPFPDAPARVRLAGLAASCLTGRAALEVLHHASQQASAGHVLGTSGRGKGRGRGRGSEPGPTQCTPRGRGDGMTRRAIAVSHCPLPNASPALCCPGDPLDPRQGSA